MSVGPQAPTPPGGPRPKRVPNKVTEEAPWVRVRDRLHGYGFAAFDVDPGDEDGMSSIDVTFCDTAPPPKPCSLPAGSGGAMCLCAALILDAETIRAEMVAFVRAVHATADG